VVDANSGGIGFNARCSCTSRPRCMLHVASCALQVVRCMLHVASCAMHVVWHGTRCAPANNTRAAQSANANAASVHERTLHRATVLHARARQRSARALASGPFNGSALKRPTCIWRHALFIPDSDMLQLGQRKCPALRNLTQGKAAQRSAGPVPVPGQCRASAGSGPVPGQCPALRNLRQGKTAIAA
jgi:hypothetical protein